MTTENRPTHDTAARGDDREDDTVERIETVLDKPDDELAAELPGLLDDIEGQTERLLLENPALFARVTRRMDAVDIAAFASESPETVERFQAMLFTGMELLARASPAVQESITEDITTNFEAADAPMTGHLRVVEVKNTVRGGTDLREDPDLTSPGRRTNSSRSSRAPRTRFRGSCRGASGWTATSRREPVWPRRWANSRDCCPTDRTRAGDRSALRSMAPLSAARTRRRATRRAPPQSRSPCSRWRPPV